MTSDEIHHFLATECGLLSDGSERGLGRTWFLGRIDWHPASTTRILRVLHNPEKEALHIRLCVSSDNNNSVFLRSPFDAATLREAVKREIALLALFKAGLVS